jgi:hypothetical protein
MAALKPKERGKKSGEGRRLTPEQEAHIQKLIAALLNLEWVRRRAG